MDAHRLSYVVRDYVTYPYDIDFADEFPHYVSLPYLFTLLL